MITPTDDRTDRAGPEDPRTDTARTDNHSDVGVAEQDTDDNIEGGQGSMAMSVLLDGRLSIVGDSADLVDHGGKPVAPLTPAGGPYRFRMRQHDRARTTYASDADALLSVLIEDYPDHVDASQETLMAAYQARVGHAAGVIFGLFASAVLTGQLSEDEEAILLASTVHTEQLPAITTEQCRRWTHPEQPMVLIRELYLADDPVRPPGGNIYWIGCGDAESYLQSLAALDQIVLQENPSVTRLPPTTITSVRARETVAGPSEAPDAAPGDRDRA